MDGQTEGLEMTENWEHFRCAALALVGPGPVKQRLCDAYMKHLRMVDEGSLPKSMQTAYAELAQAMRCARAAGGLCAVEATVRKMSDQDAGRLAAQVLEMLIVLSREDLRERAAQPQRQFRLVGDADEIPAFLNRA
jgi:hypothetical protein